MWDSLIVDLLLILNSQCVKGAKEVNINRVPHFIFVMLSDEGPDFLYNKYQGCHPIKGWMRFNRLFKYECFFVFNSKIVRIIKNGSLYQIGVVTFYLLYVIHLDACVYYQVSSWRNFTGQWAFNETRNWLLTSGYVYSLPLKFTHFRSPHLKETMVGMTPRHLTI